MRFEGFVGPTYQARSANANAERCVNLIPEMTGGTGKSKIHYLHTPGLEHFITIPGGWPVRALWAGDDRLLAVAGGWYGEIFPAGPTFTPRGPVVNDGRKAYIHSSATETGAGGHLIIVSGGRLYCDTGTSFFDMIPAASGTYLDGYFIALTPGSNEIRISGLLDGTSWNVLDSQARLSNADRLVAIAASNKRLWLFGKRNISVWWNSGNADFPFEPDESGNIEAGTVQAHAIERLDNSFFFVMEDERGGASVVRTEGYDLRTISTPAIDLRISNSVLDRFVSWSYVEAGHKFYVLTDYTGTDTFVYDVRENLWHERAYWTGTAFTAALGRCHAYTTPGYSIWGGSHFIGSPVDGKVYRQAMNLYTDAGVAIRRYRQAPHLSDDEKVTFYHEFKLDMPLIGWPSPPQITLKWSDDDGVTWTAEKSPVLNASSDAKRRIIWRRLGSSRDRIFAVTIHGITSPISINDAFLEFTKGT